MAVKNARRALGISTNDLVAVSVEGGADGEAADSKVHFSSELLRPLSRTDAPVAPAEQAAK